MNPETLVGTELVYLFQDDGGAPKEGFIDERGGKDFQLTFTTPEKKDSLRKATRNVDAKVKDQYLRARFLSYFPYKITICKIKEEGILSGKFSGCWFMWFIKDGEHYAAHIGTAASANLNMQVKKAFVDYAREPGISIVSCFHPYRAFKETELIKFQEGGHKLYILGYMTDQNVCYSIVLRSKMLGDDSERKKMLQTRTWQKKPEQVSTETINSDPLSIAERYTVVGVKKVTPQSWLKVSHTEFPQSLLSDNLEQYARMQDFKIPVHQQPGFPGLLQYARMQDFKVPVHEPGWRRLRDAVK